MTADREQQYQQRIAELEAQVQRLAHVNGKLQLRLAELETQLAAARKNSSNSSKPPSSDIVKPPGPQGPKGSLPIGGQVGHPKHERLDLPAQQIDFIRYHQLKHCPHCGGTVQSTQQVAHRLQQIELPEKPLIVTEHRALSVWCPHCRQHSDTPLPQALRRAGLLGPRLTALLGWFKSRGHDSYAILSEFLWQVAHVKVSQGLLAKAVGKIARALQRPYEALAEVLPRQAKVNVDETGHPENKKLWWTWAFRARLFTLFHIDPSRSSKVLEKLLGPDFAGIVGCDFFSAYRKYLGQHGGLAQFCLAHLIRELKFLTELPDRPAVRWARRMLRGFKRLFWVIHHRQKLGAEKFQKALERARDKLMKWGKQGPLRQEVQTLVKRFREYGADYFRFITTPGIEPTNNSVEQALRFVVIDRRLTQGTRGIRGRHWCERIWTAATTCQQQGRSLFHYLCSVMQAYFSDQPIPSLLPAEL